MFDNLNNFFNCGKMLGFYMSLRMYGKANDESFLRKLFLH